MRRVVALYRSSVGKKILMAFTGFLWFGFLLGHMAGNLKAFQGAEAFNEYAHHLRVFGEPILPEMGFLWAFRLVMLAAFGVHAWLAWETSRQSWDARQAGYRRQENLNFDFASSFMRWGGVFILVFVVFHILHMTTGTVHPSFDAGGGGRIPDAYGNLVVGLGNPLVAGFYGLAMIAICLHLYHGVWSMFQTLGAAHPKYASLRRPFAALVAVVVFLGFVSIPVSILAGIVR
ncbi:MAG TPA: succinate dehydrogenase cytochrome b subunit [Longimicrobiales bacterium]|nr:succinate dehydrogenase cytochrome b subunit [Longimicrobiales bacterium]